ncbi:restriction endonuclease subunit S [Fusobacterium russii]|uniref:restriction endonuclease subunit S n=1 Tax=Fusobacterium russii TaxID=854 RepID=UPI0003A2A9E1|nr:restriction endonuclease subunit S [Fusobacterium russii]
MQGYKDSGIEWIGEIPEIWRINKIKYIANLYGRIGWQGLTSDEYVDEGPYLITGVDFSNGKIDWNNCVHISEYRWEQADKIKIKNGDLLITKDGTVGKVAIVNNLTDKASLNSGVLLINLNVKNNKKFLFWVLCSEVFWTWFNYKNSGNSTILHLYQKDFNEFQYCMPSVQEQRQIADFLDEKCERIDRITEKIERQIEILKEYKKSLITETVTRGLNKNVKMKDSGVEWIGRIPEDWRISRIKYEVRGMGSGTTPDSSNSLFYNGESHWIQSGDIYGKDSIDDTEKKITDLAILSNRTLRFYKKPYVVVAMYGASVGNVAVSNIDAYTNQACCVIMEGKDLNYKYLYYSLIASKDQMLMIAMGGTQPNVSQQLLKNLIISVPDLSEQSQIVRFLDQGCNRLNLVISKKAKQLDIIKEHKKSLIYEYVTGKKRVGGIENGD